VVIDIGTGMGQAVLRGARREPGSLVIGVDADAGELLLLLSELTEVQVEDVVRRWLVASMARVEVRRATGADTTELSSGWARRLGIPGSRPAWIIRLRRRDRVEGGR
jgi:hypothetical protein